MSTVHVWRGFTQTKKVKKEGGNKFSLVGYIPIYVCMEEGKIKDYEEGQLLEKSL